MTERRPPQGRPIAGEVLMMLDPLIPICDEDSELEGSMSETHKNENAAWMIYRQDALRCWVFEGAISRTGDGSPEAPSGGVIETAGDACEAMARRTGRPGHYAAFSAPVTIVDLKQRA